MLTFLLCIYICIAFLLVILGVLAILKNSKRQLNLIFFYFCISLACWILTNYFSNDKHISQGVALWANHLVLFFAGTSMLLMLRFVVTIAQTNFLRMKQLIVDGIFFLVYATSLTTLVVQDIAWQDNAYAITFGPLGNLYFLVLFINAALVFLHLILGIRRNTGASKSRLIAVLFSISVWLIINLGTNMIVPLVSGTFNLTNIGPLTSVLLVAGLFYSIIRHQLFDIKLIIARSLGYVLAVGILILGYATISSLVIGSLFSGNVSSGWATAFSAIILTIAVLLYQPLKKFFDKITNNLFYQDAYNPQQFLDQLNKTVIGNIELGILLRSSAQVIESNLKCEYAVFAVFEGSKHGTRYISNKKKFKVVHEMHELKKVVAPLSKVVDRDGAEGVDTTLSETLAKNDISVLAKLISSLDASVDPTAFMLLGPKKSGNRYSQQDLQIIEIIADELVVAIQNALRFEEIQNFNVTLQEKVDEATRKLRRTNEKLKEMDETKDDFISMASHQLRTPLTSVKGYLSMVLEGDAGKVTPMQQKMLEQAFTSSQRMTYLISDLLNVSRLKTGKFVIERTPTNLVTMVQQELAQLTEAAKGRNLTLIFNPPKEFPTVLLDETKTRQLVMNFVDNAIYYTPPGGTIEIKIEDKPESIELTVVDDGLGVPRRDQPHLFTKFYRANNARKARPDGTGLGLFMAKKVVIAQGGAIIFKSQEGKGSTFGFTFPKTKDLVTPN